MNERGKPFHHSKGKLNTEEKKVNAEEHSVGQMLSEIVFTGFFHVDKRPHQSKKIY